MGLALRPVPLAFAIIGALFSLALLIDAFLVISLYAYSSSGASW